MPTTILTNIFLFSFYRSKIPVEELKFVLPTNLQQNLKVGIKETGSACQCIRIRIFGRLDADPDGQNEKKKGSAVCSFWWA